MNKPYFPTIDYLRILLIFLLLFTHAFAPFTHAWPLPPCVHPVYLYKIIGSISYSFMLPMFVFISGYLFQSSLHRYQNPSGYWQLLWHKAQRLLLPSFLFSTLYFILFIPADNLSFATVLYDLLNGEGHLWFLPMLFWCFPLLWTIRQIQFPFLPTFLLLIALHFLFSSSLPFRLSESLYYIIYFYLGAQIRRYPHQWRPYVSLRNSLIALFIYLPAVLFLTPMRTLLLRSSAPYVPYVVYFINLTISLSGIIFTYLFISLLTQKHTHRASSSPSSSVRTLASYSFGVYIIHQFILQAIYYHSPLPQYLGTLTLPWGSLLLTLPLSLLLTHLIHLNRYTRPLLR